MSNFTKTPDEKQNQELAKLVDINSEAVDFYNAAQDKVESLKLKETFKDLELIHGNTVRRLKTVMSQKAQSEQEYEPLITFKGTTNRMFGTLKASISQNPDAELVKHLEEAEDQCLHSVEDALKRKEISDEVRHLLVSELEALRKSHEHMRFMKQTLAA